MAGTRPTLSKTPITKSGTSRYRFGRPIGDGGMGEVRHAKRLDTDGEVTDDRLAVKHLKAKLLRSPEAVRRFKREVRLQQRLDHPHVMPIIARNLSASPPWFVMPLADGSLDQRILHAGGMTLAEATAITRAILEGVAHAHDQDVVHRDLKPLNVMLVDGVTKVSDFGLGKDLQPGATELTRSHQQMGTAPYMAPEQFDSPKTVEKPADVYAIGKTLCKICTGRSPPIRAVDLAGVPREFHYFIGRCCDPDPARRYADAREALEAFSALVEDDVDEHQAAQRLVRDAHEAIDDDGAIGALLAYLTRHADDEELYIEVVPRMPPDLVVALVSADARAFARVLTAFDEHVDGGLPFDYCDVVARFYRVIWLTTADLIIRETVLRRLIVMGTTHNRWMVRDVVSEILTTIDDDDTATAMMAAHVIRAEQYHASWHAEQALAAKPHRIVARALRAALDGTPS